MPDEQPKDVKKSRGLQESRGFVGNRVEPTSSTNVETPATSRPSKKK